MTGDEKPEQSDLKDLGDRLAKARGEDREADEAKAASGAMAGDGLRVAIEFVVSVFVGTGIGFAIGSYFGQPVIGLLIGMPFGFAAGLRTVYRGLMANQDADKERDVPDGND